MKNGLCPKCGSKKIIPDCTLSIGFRPSVNPMLQDHALWVQTEKRGEGLIQQQPRMWVCGNCGLVEFYIDRPEEFYEAHESWLRDEAG